MDRVEKGRPRQLNRAAALLALVPAGASACTLCHSDAAAAIRARLAEADLAWNLCVTAIPLLLLLAIVAAVAREPVRR